MAINKAVIKRFCVMFVAVFLIGFALSFLIEVNWGLDPASFCNTSISKYIGLTLGTWQLIMLAMLLVVVFAADRTLIGVGTIVNMVMIGYTADFFHSVWERCIPRAVFASPSFIALKVAIFIAAIALFVFSAAVYMNTDMGLSPYDAIPKIISDRLKKVPFALVRIAYDISMILLGVIFCARAAPHLLRALPGALIMSVSLGPAITVVGKRMRRMK